LFKKLLRALFPSFTQKKNTNTQENLAYFERTRHVEKTNTHTNHQLSTTAYPSVSSTVPSKVKPLSINPLNQNDINFHNYLFGQSLTHNDNDPFSEFVGQKIEKLLLSPKHLLNELPVMPASVNTLIAELKSEHFNIDKILDVIAREPSMAADVIKLANSALYKRSEKEVLDLKTAFMNMGAKGLSEGLLLSYLKKYTPSANVYFKQFGDKIWQHSLQTALYAKKLAKNNVSTDEASAYFVGLLNNLGKMIIFQIMVEAFSYVDPEATPNSQAFKNLITQYAMRLTYTIAKSWQLPEEVILALALLAKNQAHKNTVAATVFDANIISELQCIRSVEMIDDEEFKQLIQKHLINEQSKQLTLN